MNHAKISDTITARTVGAIAFAVLSAGAACKNAEQVAPAPKPMTVTATSPPTPTPTPPAGPPASSASTYVTAALGDRLAKEAATRPTTGLRAEAVLAALASVGVTPKTSQCLGDPLGAAYCVAGATTDGIAVSVTEFATPAAASAGRAASQTRFGDRIPNRRQLVRGATMLTLSAAEPLPLLDKAQAAFEALPLP